MRISCNVFLAAAFLVFAAAPVLTAQDLVILHTPAQEEYTAAPSISIRCFPSTARTTC